MKRFFNEFRIPVLFAVVVILAAWATSCRADGPVKAPPVAFSAPQSCASSTCGNATRFPVISSVLNGEIVNHFQNGIVMQAVTDFASGVHNRREARHERRAARRGCG